MKYLYWDLGEQQRDNGVVVHLGGSTANVILLDPVSFDRYRYGLSFRYTGGLHAGTPVRLEIPNDGHWYLVVDCCGYHHHVQVKKIQMLPADVSPRASDADPRASEEDPRVSEVGSTLAGVAA